MNIRQLETFLAVAEHGSFRRAAEQLHRSQSVVSTHIQQLEEELGLPLFERTTRRVAMTSHGRTLLLRSQSVMADLGAITREFREESELRRGRVSIGAASSVSGSSLPSVLAAYRDRYPGVRLELREAFAEQMYADVYERVTDFAVGPRIEGVKDFDIQTIAKDPIVALLPRSYPLGTRKTLSLREIADHPFLTMPKGTHVRARIEAAFLSHGKVFSPAFEVAYPHTLLGLVEAGLGTALMPALCVPARDRRRFRMVPVSAPAILRDVCLIVRKGRVLSPAAARCAEMVIKGLQ